MERSDRETRRLHEQVERIIDEGTGSRRSVIVRMAEPQDGDGVTVLVGTATDAIRARRLSLTARDILPSSAEVVRGKTPGKLSARERRVLAQDQVSSVAQVAAADVTTVTKRHLASSGRKAVAPLLSSDAAKKAIAAPKRGAGTGTGVFWSSRSAALELHKDDLARLPDEVPTIMDIAPNRVLRIPPTVEVKTLPRRAAENKASSWGIYRIGAMSAWGGYGARGRGVVVAVLDTGIDAEHPDLQGKIAAWAEFDLNGREVTGSKPHDSDQHGTHVAGTIVGGNASGKWNGVAP